MKRIVLIATAALLLGGIAPASADTGPTRDTSSATESHAACLEVVNGLVQDASGYRTINVNLERYAAGEIARLERKVDRKDARILLLQKKLAKARNR